MNNERPFDVLLRHYGVKDAFNLDRYVTTFDQLLMKNDTWDYRNRMLVNNEARELLETLDRTGMTDEENFWANQIIWWWYHHATSTALSKFRDGKAAQGFAEKALHYHGLLGDHPNRYPKLLYFIAHKRFQEAREYLLFEVPAEDPDWFEMWDTYSQFQAYRALY